jgi:hypothetical protein
MTGTFADPPRFSRLFVKTKDRPLLAAELNEESVFFYPK